MEITAKMLMRKIYFLISEVFAKPSAIKKHIIGIVRRPKIWITKAMGSLKSRNAHAVWSATIAHIARYCNLALLSPLVFILLPHVYRFKEVPPLYDLHNKMIHLKA